MELKIKDIQLKLLPIIMFGLSLIIIGIVFKTIGIYFEEDEVFANYFFSLNGLFLSPHLYFNEEYFLINNLIISLQHLFKNINVFTCYKVLSMSIILSYFFSIAKKHTTSKRYLAIYILLISALFLSSIVLINNVRLSYWFAFLAFFYLYTHQNNESKHPLLHFYFLVFLALTSRFQITLIVFSLAFIFSFLFLNKWAKTHLFIAVIICAGLFGMFNFYTATYNPKTMDFYNYELSVYDRNDFVLQEIYQKENIIEYLNTLNTKELEYIAKSLFLLDKNLDTISYEEIVLHPSLINYVLQNEQFLKIYGKKLNSLKQNIWSHYAYLVILIALLIMAFIVKLKSNKERIKVLFFLSIYFALPLLISVLGTVPNKFLAPFLAAPIIMIVFQFLSQKGKFSSSVLLVSLILIGAQTAFITIPESLEVKRQEYAKLCLKKKFETESVIFLNYFDTEAFSSKAFELFNKNEVVFLDLGGFIDYPSIRLQNEKYFGEGSNNLLGRYEYVINHGGVVYGSMFQMVLVQNYLLKVHQYPIHFESEQACEGLSIFRFYISNVTSLD
jgi:hypothetical protein